MSIEHATPRPWEIHVGQLLIDVHRGNYLIADLVNPARSHEEAAANAELIVTAVNHHDALLDALKAILAICGAISWITDPDVWGNAQRDAIRSVATNAIRAAEGGEE